MKKSILFACLCCVVSVFVTTSVDAGKLKKVKVTAARNSILILYTYGPKEAGIFEKHGIDLEIDVRPFKGHMAGLPAGEVPCTTYAGTAAIARINMGLDWVIVGGGLTVMQEVFVLKNYMLFRVFFIREHSVKFLVCLKLPAMSNLAENDGASRFSDPP